MSIVNDKISQIKLEKENIKTALENLGIDMTNVAFTQYHEKIEEISKEYFIERDRIYLLKNGDECTDITGGYTLEHIRTTNGYHEVYYNNGSNNGTAKADLVTKNTIDVAGQYLCVEAYVKKGTTNGMQIILSGLDTPSFKVQALNQSDVDFGEPSIYKFRIPEETVASTVRCYFPAGGSGGNLMNGCYVSKIWLEPIN